MERQAPRIKTIDIVRGIALLGILIINIQTYSLFLFLQPGQVYELQLDHPDGYGPLQFAITLLVRNEFYAIYSFLFGFGFYAMFRKNELQGLNASAIYQRRLWILLGIGVVHGLFFWFGDVLHKYAIIGFSLLYFNSKPVHVIVKWIIGLFVFTVLFHAGKALLHIPNATETAQHQMEMDATVMTVVDTWRNGSFLQVLALQKKGMLMLFVTDLANGFPSLIQAEMMFLAGLIAGKINLFSNLRDSITESRLISGALVSMPLALALKGLFCVYRMDTDILPPYLLRYKEVVYPICGIAGSLLLAMVYLPVLFILLRDNHLRIFNWIGNAGKMGLTNYLGQTIICMLIFYGYAGGLSGRVTLFQSLMLALMIYTVQVILSNLWLQYHTSGPLELLWKKIVYRKKKSSEKKFSAAAFNTCRKRGLNECNRMYVAS